jgi:hypothetical protein
VAPRAATCHARVGRHAPTECRGTFWFSAGLTDRNHLVRQPPGVPTPQQPAAWGDPHHFVHVRVHANRSAAWQHDLDQSLGTQSGNRRNRCLRFAYRRRHLRHQRCRHLPLSSNHIDPCKARRRMRRRPVHPSRQLLTPSIELSRRDPVLVDDFARPNPSPEALRNDLPLLLDRPAPSPLAAGDHLDPLRRSSHMTTPMTAPYRSVALDCPMLAVHAKPSAHDPRAAQGGLCSPEPAGSTTPHPDVFRRRRLTPNRRPSVTLAGDQNCQQNQYRKRHVRGSILKADRPPIRSRET